MTPAHNIARNWSRITGALFLFVEAWLLLILFSAVGVGLDIRPFVYPWLAAMTLTAIWLVAARGLRAILPFATLLSLGNAAFWAWISAALSPVLWFGFVVVVVPSVAASLSAARGLLSLRANPTPAPDPLL